MSRRKNQSESGTPGTGKSNVTSRHDDTPRRTEQADRMPEVKKPIDRTSHSQAKNPNEF